MLPSFSYRVEIARFYVYYQYSSRALVHLLDHSPHIVYLRISLFSSAVSLSPTTYLTIFLPIFISELLKWINIDNNPGRTVPVLGAVWNRLPSRPLSSTTIDCDGIMIE